MQKGPGETAGTGESLFEDAGMDTGDAQVGIWPHVKDGDSGTETDDAQVGVVPRLGAVAGAMTGLVLVAEGGDNGVRIRDRGQGGG